MAVKHALSLPLGCQTTTPPGCQVPRTPSDLGFLVELIGSYSNRGQMASELRKLSDRSRLRHRSASPPAPKQVHRRLRPAEVDEVVALYLAGATLRQLGQQFRVHRTTVSELLQQRGIQRRYRALTPDQESEAVQLYASGMSLVDVGGVLHVNAGTIWHVLKRRCVPLRDCHGKDRT
jgi:DNA-directed RNA polymerase specialized sigma24 family protein